MAESLKQKTVKGTIWSAVEAFSTQGIQFLVTLVMARILTPADFGIVGMITVFIAISNVFINSGFTSALIRKPDRTEADNSTVFYFNIVVAFILYIILFFCAPLIADFYDQPILTLVTRIISLSFVIGSFNVVQRAQYNIKLDFKTQAKGSLIGVFLSGFIGILMAYLGYGVWALVAQQLSNLVFTSIFLWIYSSWRPQLIYSWKSFRDMFSFGSRMLISSILDTVYTNVYSLVIGKVYKASDLGYYNRAQSFTSISSSNITGVIQRVTFPVLASIQNEDERLREGYRRILRISGFIIFPLMLMLAALSKPLIITLLTEKWMYSSLLLVPICFSSMWYPIHAINLNLLQVKGRSDLFLRLEIIKKVMGVSILIGTVPLGLYWMCWGSVLSALIGLIINTHYTGKLLNLGFLKQMKDLTPVLILSLIMGSGVWFTIKYLPLTEPVLLIIGIIEGALIYLAGAKLFQFPEFTEIRYLLKRNKQ